MVFKQVYNPYFDQDKEVKTFSFNGKKLTALYLYREHDQEIGFKENPLLNPLVFTWKKPIYTCLKAITDTTIKRTINAAYFNFNSCYSF